MAIAASNYTMNDYFPRYRGYPKRNYHMDAVIGLHLARLREMKMYNPRVF